jgi:hypothetical protein
MPKYLYILFKKKNKYCHLTGPLLPVNASQQWSFGPLLTLDPFFKIFNFDY